MSISPSNDLASMSRSAQRKLRLLEIEQQQRLEDMEALRMTEEQRQTLLRSFTSVKVEFSDLDGLSWTGSALRLPNSSRQDSSSTSSPSPDRLNCAHHNARPSSPSSPAFTVLTNTDLGLLDDNTIRATSRSGSPCHPSQLYQRSPRSRSPVKAIFSTGDTPASEGANTDDVFSHDDSKSRSVEVQNISDLNRGHNRRAIASEGSSSFISTSGPSAPRFITYSCEVGSTSPATRRFPQPIVVINDDDDIDDELKTPVAPRRSPDTFLASRDPSGGLKKRKR